MNSNPAQNCPDLASPRFEHPLARRTTALITHAQALMSSPSVFWQTLPDGTMERQKLAALVQEVRSIEEAVYLGLAMRVSLIIRQQRLDRACWDVLSNARQIVKSQTDNSWAERWAELGFFDGSLRIPAAFESRLRALSCLVEYLTLYPDQEDAVASVTCSHCGEILRDFAAVIQEGERLRANLEQSIGKLNSAVTILKTTLNAIHVSFYGTLRSHDPRWMGLFPLLMTSSVNSADPETVSSNGSMGQAGVAGASQSGERRCEKTVESSPPNPQNSSDLVLENAQGVSVASALAWLLPPG